MTVVSDYRSLLSNYAWDAAPGAGIILTYSFSAAPTASLQANNPTAAATFTPLNASEQATVQAALAQWSAASGITFEQTTSAPGDITFGFYNLSSITNQTGEAGLGNYPSTGTYVDGNGVPQIYSNFLSEGGDVYFDTSYQTNPAYFSDFAHVAIHEIGHAIGLKHPFDDATTGPDDTLNPSLDNGSETVMAYAGLRSPTLEPLDIGAVQYLYGTPTTATHPVTETWNAATQGLTVTGSATTAQQMFGSAGNDVFYSLGPHDALSGGGGNDLFYLDGKPAGVNGGDGSGTETVVTGLAYATLADPVQTETGASNIQYIYLPAYNDFQTYSNATYLEFTDGIYSVPAATFTSWNTVASPGTTNPDTYAWSAASSGTWGNAANWTDQSYAATLLPPGANDVVGLTGAATAAAPSTIGGRGNAALLDLSSGYTSLTGTFGLGALEIGPPATAAGLIIASGAKVAVSGAAYAGLVSATQAAAGTPALAVAAGGALQLGSLSLRGPGSVQYVLTGLGGPTLSVAAASIQAAAAAAPDDAANISLSAALPSTDSPPVAPPELLTAPDPDDDAPPGATGGGATIDGTPSTPVADAPPPSPTDLSAAAQALVTAPAGGTLEVGTSGNAAAGALTIDPGAMLSGAGDVAASIVNNGAIIATGGTLALAAPVSGAGAMQVAAAAQLVLDGAVTQAVTFTASTGTLDIVNPTSGLDAGTITGFGTGDTIELVSPTAGAITSATYTGTGSATGRLSLGRGGATVATLQLAGTYTAAQFHVATRPGGVADITLAAPVAPTPADPLFDATYYLAHNPDVAAAGVDPYQHYLAFGWKEGRDPSALFDGNFYLAQNPDVKAAGIDPLVHFEQFGWKEGRDPSLLFSDGKYLAANPDVAAAGLDPLLHYTVYGQHEGRAAFLTGGAQPADILVNPTYYDPQLGATLIPTGTAAAQQAASSYNTTGWLKGLNPDAFFNTSYYLAHNPDVAAAHIDPLTHYEVFGWKEGRDPSAAFSTNKYLAAYTDVRAAGLDPLIHYIAYGQAEGRTAFPA